MARVTAPFPGGMPGFEIGGLQVFVPVDLTEGGQLYVTVGQTPIAVPQASVLLPPGCLVCIIGPQAAEHLRPALNRAVEIMEREAPKLPPGLNGVG